MRILNFIEFKILESIEHDLEWDKSIELNELNIQNILKAINIRSKATMSTATKRASAIRQSAANQVTRLNKMGQSDQAIRIKTQAEQRATKIIDRAKEQVTKMKDKGKILAAKAKEDAKKAKDKLKGAGIKTAAKPTTVLI